jgi:hypothetical protein
MVERAVAPSTTGSQDAPLSVSIPPINNRCACQSSGWLFRAYHQRRAV